MKINRNCKTCNKEFLIDERAIKRERGKYCSRKCKGMGWNSKLEHNIKWNGGRSIHSSGYILIKNPTHPRATYNGYVREHHIVLEKKIGKYLDPNEEVHHINGIKTDNRPDNLQLISSRSEHVKMEHKLGTYKDHLLKLNGGYYI